MPRYQNRPFDYVTPPGISAEEPRHKVVIVGAGPVGLSLAIDLAMKKVPVVVLDDNNVVSVGSRAICWAKRTLEIFHRLGVGERMLEKGVTWKVGRLFHGNEQVYQFDLLPEEGHKYPAFINLQQYYVEEYLVDRARNFPDLIDLRFKNRVVSHVDHGDHVTLDVETPDGLYNLEADFYVACDGAKSATRQRMNLPFEGETFEENFLIIDVEMATSPFKSDVPERWFWFKPPFHKGQSALLHKQPDDIYRIDLQLGPDADPQAEMTQERIEKRIKAIVGDLSFTLDWASVYQFRCVRLEKFRHNRVIFAGDSAHVVSPFGARGGNGGIQDIDNLGWKLARVIKGQSDESLLDTYDEERGRAADENILNSARATNFMTPKSPIETLFRNAVLNLAEKHPFARSLINSGRLSVPCKLDGLSLQSDGDGVIKPGDSFVDAPLDGGRFLIDLISDDFLLFSLGQPPQIDGIEDLDVVTINLASRETQEAGGGVILNRYAKDAIYLLRPDGHIAAVFENPDKTTIEYALRRASGHGDVRDG